MWATISGLRVLRGQESELVRRAVEQMLSGLIDQWERSAAGPAYGVECFDQWDPEQRIWLLSVVTAALFFEHQPPPPQAAIFEATIDAIFCHIVAEIEQELDQQFDSAHSEGAQRSWREDLIAAYEYQQRRRSKTNCGETEIGIWYTLAFQVADAILGHASYQRAEEFRDGPVATTQRFLRQRALPDDFLQRIPPLCGDQATRASIDSLRQNLIC